MMWTPEMDAALTAGIQSGLSSSLIAKQMGGGLTRNSVIGRCFRLKVNGGEKRCPRLTERGEARPPRLRKYRKPGALTDRYNLSLPPSWRALMAEAATGCSVKPTAYIRLAIIERLKADGFEPESSE